MASFAKVTLLGRLGKDAEYSNNSGDEDKGMAKFSVATDKYAGKDESTGKPKYETQWWSVVVFGKQAAIARDKAKKGTTVHVEGEVTVNEKDGKSYVNVKSLSTSYLGQYTTGTAAASSNEDSESAPAAAAKPAAAKAAVAKAAPAAVAEPETVDDDSDDLPF